MAQTGQVGGRFPTTEDNRIGGGVGGAPPKVQSAAEQSIEANQTQLPGGFVPDNSTNHPSAPPSVLKDYPGGSAQGTQDGSPNTNRYSSSTNTKVGI